jgi:pimeloyl-ACP methyl ester carboxylesterase
VAAERREPLEREIVVNGTRLAYRATMARGSLAPVVLLHGWGADAGSFTGVCGGLSERWPTLAFDLPGFGASDPPPAPWGSPEYAACIKQALEQLGLRRAHFIGHSFGGKIAILIAARWPALVRSLVLANSAGIRPERTLLYGARVAGYKAARRLAGQGALGAWLAQRVGSTDYRQAGSMRATLVRAVNEDLRPLLREVRAPTLLVWGDRDQETPLSNARIMERGIPDAGLVVFPGAGHFSFADDLPRFCRVVENFLKVADQEAPGQAHDA